MDFPRSYCNFPSPSQSKEEEKKSSFYPIIDRLHNKFPHSYSTARSDIFCILRTKFRLSLLSSQHQTTNTFILKIPAACFREIRLRWQSLHHHYQSYISRTHTPSTSTLLAPVRSVLLTIIRQHLFTEPIHIVSIVQSLSLLSQSTHSTFETIQELLTL